MRTDQALGLPPGSIRALLTILLVLALIAGAFWQIPDERFAALKEVALVMVSLYTGGKMAGVR